MPSPKFIQISQASSHVGQDVELRGWVHNIRDMGKIVFIELRDPTGIIQLVADEGVKLPKLGSEFVVKARGKIKDRDAKFVNPKLATGKIEMAASELSVINPSSELPFEVAKDTSGVNEELRLKYRYLDLRSERMAVNLKLRHKVASWLRRYLDDQGFVDVATPILTKGTPEGAREFIVPSRLHPGEFYVLPQAPQQFKQMLMLSGIGRYYQFAVCLRDEDQRGDRQPEFMQLDMELSFVDQEDILQLNEQMVSKLIQEVLPGKKVSKSPFPRLTYAEAMEKYGTDKPDLRKDPKDPDELAFCWVTDFPMFEIETPGSKINAVHHPFTSPLPEDVNLLEKEPTQVRASAYDLVLNGYEVAGGSIRIHDAQLQTKVFELLGLGQKEIQQRFGHMVQAFQYGAPPHGGIAYGFDRLIMILAGEPNIREVMAFPKTGEGKDPLTGAPTPVPPAVLRDAHINLVKPSNHSGGK